MTQRLHFVVVAFLAAIFLQQQSSTTSRFGVTVVEALPSGAAGCAGGAAASVGFHTDYGPGSESGRVGDTGVLSAFNTTLYINDQIMDPANVTIFRGGRVMNWTVTAEPDLPIRGVLFRVSSKNLDAEFTLTGDANLQPAAVCLAESGNVEGITHRTRVEKLNVSGTMRVDTNGLLDIDLTVVYMNGRVAPGDLSLYAYSGFEIDIRNSPPIVPAPVPVAPPPTASPVEDRCATNTCTARFGLPGRLHNRFRGGQCRERCSAVSFFVSSLFGWQCGGCF